MIVLGADTRKRSHTIAAVSAATGELMGEQTVQVGAKGFDALVVWARELGSERVWALEDCRHVSGSFERFLIDRGERVLRVPTRLMANTRRGGRERGKSDSIGAIAVARAALREGLDALPAAQLEGPSASASRRSIPASGCEPASRPRAFSAGMSPAATATASESSPPRSRSHPYAEAEAPACSAPRARAAGEFPELAIARGLRTAAQKAVSEIGLRYRLGYRYEAHATVPADSL